LTYTNTLNYLYSIPVTDDPYGIQCVNNKYGKVMNNINNMKKEFNYNVIIILKNIYICLMRELAIYVL